MQYYQSWKNCACSLRRWNLHFIGRAYAVLLWLPVHAAHLSCVLWQQELHHHCLKSGLYGVCSGQSPHVSGETLSLSPGLISTPSMIRSWRPFLPWQGGCQVLSRSRLWSHPAARIPSAGGILLGGTHWLWVRLLRWVTQGTHHRGKQMVLCCLPSKLSNNLLACSHN